MNDKYHNKPTISQSNYHMADFKYCVFFDIFKIKHSNVCIPTKNVPVKKSTNKV